MLVAESTKRIGIMVDIEDVRDGEGEGKGPLDE